MTEKEFKEIIKPIHLLQTKERQFLLSALMGNYRKWLKKKKREL